MSEGTTIEWTDASLSPWWGCTKVSPGCANCYAEGIDWRFARGQSHWGKGAPRKRIEGFPEAALALHRKAERTGKRIRVFPSMCDPFDAEVSIGWLADFLNTIRLTPNLVWQVLTKRPELWRSRSYAAMVYAADQANIAARTTGLATKEQAALANWIAAWLDGHPPRNVWIGTSVEDQTRGDDRIPHLLKIPAAVRFVSCEPLLGGLDLRTLIYRDWDGIPPEMRGDVPDGIHWVIAGGESGPKARPMHPAWVRSLRDQCVDAGVPFFFKQWGGTAKTKKAAGRTLDGRTWDEMPAAWNGDQP